MSRIVIFGGHGKVALLATPLLVQQGHEVTSIIRNPDHGDDVSAVGGHPLVADVETLDVDAVTDLVQGHDAMLWSAGAGGGDPARTRRVDRDAAIASVDAATAAGVERYVMVSYLGAGPDHGVDPANSFFTYAEAKAAADEHLRASSLAWTVLGPGMLTSEPGTGRVEIGANPTSSSVARADVAAMAVAVLARPDTAGMTIPFNSGDIPIAEALTAIVRV